MVVECDMRQIVLSQFVLFSVLVHITYLTRSKRARSFNDVDEKIQLPAESCICDMCMCMCRRLRDPLNNVGFVFNKAVDRLKTNRRNPSLQMALYDHVHPDLSVS
jgi:hypothetical protein